MFDSFHLASGFITYYERHVIQRETELTQKSCLRVWEWDGICNVSRSI